MGYLYLALAIFFELVGTVFLKLSDGMSHIGYTISTFVAYGICFVVFSLSLKTVPLNIAYATWSGVGVIFAALLSFVLFDESISIPSALGILDCHWCHSLSYVLKYLNHNDYFLIKF
jgi:small multidrug resistance pump